MAIFARLSSCTSSLFLTHDSIECISILISPSTIITCIYVPPSADLCYHRALNDFLANLSPVYTHLILGDFNMPDIDWLSMSASTMCSEMFCDAIVDFNLFQLLDKPTHITGSILDLMLTDHPEHVSDVTVHDINLSSDHYLITTQ